MKILCLENAHALLFVTRGHKDCSHLKHNNAIQKSMHALFKIKQTLKLLVTNSKIIMYQALILRHTSVLLQTIIPASRIRNVLKSRPSNESMKFDSINVATDRQNQ